MRDIMDTSIVVGVLALCGTIIGAATGWASNMLSARNAAHAAAQAERQQSAERRHSACIEYIASLDRFIDRARHIAGAIDQIGPDEIPSGRRQGYEDAWSDFAGRSANVDFACTPDQADAATAVRAAAASVGNLIDRRLVGSRWPSGYDEALVDLAAKRRIFIDKTR